MLGVWVWPGHAGFSAGNMAKDYSAEDALDGDILDETSFSLLETSSEQSYDWSLARCVRTRFRSLRVNADWNSDFMSW